MVASSFVRNVSTLDRNPSSRELSFTVFRTKSQPRKQVQPQETHTAAVTHNHGVNYIERFLCGLHARLFGVPSIRAVSVATYNSDTEVWKQKQSVFPPRHLLAISSFLIVVIIFP